MKLHFLTVPIHGSAAAEEELNQFLANHRVLAVDRQLVADGARSTWAVCITWVERPEGGAPAPGAPGGKKPQVDYRALLPEAEFQVFARLRALRKQLAERDGVPPYALFTNEQLAEMVQKRVRSASELAQIDGVGPARLEKYGRAFLDLLAAAPPPLPGAPATAPPAPPAEDNEP